MTKDTSARAMLDEKPRQSGRDRIARTAALLRTPRPTTGPTPELLTEDEHRAIEMAGELAGLLRRIIGDGPQARFDWAEFAAPIHVIQRGVMKQAAARAYPDRYRLLGQVIPEHPDDEGDELKVAPRIREQMQEYLR